jgi:hypothetical protein
VRKLTNAEVDECYRVANDYVRAQAKHMPDVPLSNLMAAVDKVAKVLIMLKLFAPASERSPQGGAAERRREGGGQ